MRTIKFRVWDKARREMITSTNNHYISFNGCLFWQFGFDTFEPLNMRDFELMQFTGLTDKNGVEIYEGDILTSDVYPFTSDGDKNYVGEVYWWADEYAYYVDLHAISDRVRGAAVGGMLSEIEHKAENYGGLEVIGNIYENSELLEAE